MKTNRRRPLIGRLLRIPSQYRPAACLHHYRRMNGMLILFLILIIMGALYCISENPRS